MLSVITLTDLFLLPIKTTYNGRIVPLEASHFACKTSFDLRCSVIPLTTDLLLWHFDWRKFWGPQQFVHLFGDKLHVLSGKEMEKLPYYMKEKELEQRNLGRCQWAHEPGYSSLLNGVPLLCQSTQMTLVEIVKSESFISRQCIFEPPNAPRSTAKAYFIST